MGTAEKKIKKRLAGTKDILIFILDNSTFGLHWLRNTPNKRIILA
jgi:hypothetical protein